MSVCRECDWAGDCANEDVAPIECMYSCIYYNAAYNPYSSRCHSDIVTITNEEQEERQKMGIEISEDTIEKLIEKEVKLAIGSFDMEELIREMIASTVVARVDGIINNAVKSEIETFAREEARRIIVDYISVEAITTDDGWGNIKDYGSFADFYKQLLRKEIGDEYKIQRMAKDVIQEKVRKDVGELNKDIIARVTAELTSAIGEEGK